MYSHPSRRAVFLGDFIDRGPHQREVVDIARAMIETGSALAVMGNHEFNAIAFATVDVERGGYLRRHSEKNCRQHQAFLDAYVDDPEAYDEAIAWFRTLPLWLDLGELRVVHACWDTNIVHRIGVVQRGSNLLSDDLLEQSCYTDTWQFEAIETLLKGKEIPLSEGVSYLDKEGTVRHKMRVRWWDETATTFNAAFMGPESARTHIPDDDILGDHLIEYSHAEPPVFLGHYWLEGIPQPLAPNIACLDYSVAKAGGKLAAYRWDGERALSAAHFVTVDRQEEV